MKTIILLHGAIGAADQLQALKAKLQLQYKVYEMSFSGHGGVPYAEGGFSIQQFSQEVLQFIADNNIDKPSIFGYSMGGYVAMYIAKHHPEKIDKVVTLATKFHWDEPTAQKETGMLNADAIAAKVPAFAGALEKRHAPNDWKEVLGKTKDMLIAMGNDNPLKPEEYKDIQTPTQILLGDRDKMVTLDETLLVYKALPNAQMGLLPNTQHPIEQVDTALLSFFITRFIA